MPVLKPLTTNEFTIKDYFHFAEEVVEQQSDFFMHSLDVDSLFTNILLEEIIDICTNEFLIAVQGLKTSEFKELLSTKDSHLALMEHFINKSIVWTWVSL